MSEEQHETSTAEAFANTRERISKACIATHRKDRQSLERVRDHFVGALEHCPRCKFYPPDQCPACNVVIGVMADIEKALETLPGQVKLIDHQAILEQRYP